MTDHLRTIVAIAGVVAAATTLSACSLLGPARGADGRVTEPSEINSPTLLVGDCFSFVDGTDLAKVTVTPCANDHTYIVIGDGTLSSGQIDKDGGLQNAVSAACSEVFTQFKAAAADGVKPEQQFIVSTAEKDGAQVTSYLCVATDAAAAAVG